MRVLVAAALAALSAAWPAPGRTAQSTAYVLTSDYSTGRLAAVDLATRGVSPRVARVHSDARLRCDGGLVYVVNRFGQDNIQVIDPARGCATVRQFSTGNGSNPQDIAFVSPGKAYVSCLASPSLLVVNPATGATLGSIPLAEFADADGIPEMARMAVVGDRVFVALQRLANFVPTESSLVAVIDAEADTVLDCDPARPGRQAIRLAGTNPVTTLEWDAASGRLLIGCAGHWGQLDGGIEWLDPVALASGGWAATEQTLGGDVLDIAWNGPDHSYAIVSDAGFNTALVSWSAVTGGRVSTLYAPVGFSLADCAVNDREELYVCDSQLTSPGLYVFSTATDLLLAGPLGTGLPPVEVGFSSAACVPLPPASLTAPWPNPAAVDVSCTLALGLEGRVRIEVFDLGGRLVRTLLSGRVGEAPHTFTWDLKNDGGVSVVSGIYVLRARAGSGTWTRRVVVIR